MKHSLGALCALAVVLVASACLDENITGTRPLSMSLTASPSTTTVGAEVTFSYNATGTGLTAVIVAFGDGVADTVVTAVGAVEASGTFTHSYSAIGTYVATGSAQTVLGTGTDEVTVVVN